MIEELRKNPINISKYDKDKEQLKYEKEILDLLKKKHSIIRYIHPAVIYKNSELIMNIIGNSNKYLAYLPESVINKYQDLIFNYSYKNPQLLKYVYSKKQLENIEEVIDIVKKDLKIYDYLDVKIKKKNKDLFLLALKELYKVTDEYIVDFYYNISLDSDNLLHIINPLFFDKELVSLLGDSINNIIYCKDIVSSLEKLVDNKYRYKIFKSLLRIYNNDGYIEMNISKIIDIVSVDYYFYKEKDGVYSLDKDIYYHLYRDSLSVNELKYLYYLLTNNLIHVNNREEFYNFINIRKDYLDSKNPSSYREFKDLIYEYKYALNYDEVKGLINKYSSGINTLLEKYKKYKYNIEEIDEYEILLILNNMIEIYDTYNLNDLLEILEEERINYKPIKSMDIRINIDNRLKRIYSKEYTDLWNKRLSYIKEEEILYEDLAPKNRLFKEYIGKKVKVKYIDPNNIFNILIKEIDDNDNSFVKVYKNISNEYLVIDSDSYYYRYNSIDNNRVVDISNKNSIMIEGNNKKISLLVFNKVNSDAIKQAIDSNVIIEVLDIKEAKNYINGVLKALNSKILHYIDETYPLEWSYLTEKYTPLECINILFMLYEDLYISTNDSNYDKDKVTKMIINIIRKVDDRKDNIVLINQVLDKISDSLEYLNNNFDRRIVYKELDVMYRKYDLYRRNNYEYMDIITLLNDSLDYVVLTNKYNKNQIEYNKIYKYIDFKYIVNNLNILIDNYYDGDIYSVIRRCILANILAYINKYDIKEAILGTMYKEIGKLDNYICGDYSASIFRKIYKKELNKEIIDNICAAIDLQDSRESISSIKTKYKIKDLDRTIELANIIKDSYCLDNYRYKRDLVSKDASRLIKIKDTISKIIRDYRLNELLNKKYISNKEYNEYLVNDISIEDIWKRL